ncbi:putative polyketide synthase [Trichoderma afarasin]
MAEQLSRLVIFGDQDADTLSYIKSVILQSRNLPYASRFLRDCADEVQAILSGLDAEERRRYSRFEDILELAVIHAELSDKDLSIEAISTVLLFISQFGDLIVRTEQDPSLLSTSYMSSVYIIGLSFGLFSAASVATARDVGELLAIGRALVAVAFRLGLQQTRNALEIESMPGLRATEVANIAPREVETVINAFNNDMAIPKHRRMYIRTITKRGVVISGPPSLFSELYSYSPILASAPKTRLPLKGVAHAPHVPALDIDEILGISSVLRFPVREKVHVVSTSAFRPFKGQDLGSMLAEVLVDITQRTQNLAEVSNYCVSEFQSGRIVELVTIGPQSQAGGSFKEDLEAEGICFNLRPAIQSNMEGLRDGSDLVAVVGMSSRLPGSEDVDSFWENLQAGRQFESEIPASRFDLEAHYDATGTRKNTTTSCYGCFLENPGFFDNRLFSISPREAEQMDPVHRILLMCSYEALQMAGYSPEATLSTNRNRIATYFAQAGDDYRECNANQDIDLFLIQGGTRAFAPGRLHNHYKWAGESHSVDTACSGSSTCIILAINALLSRECDTALAGGGSILTAPDMFAGLSRAGFLSKTPGGCKTFREDADGYCRADGVGLVVLKRLEDAVSDNDNILAVLRRGARNSSWNSISITHPSADAQVSVVRDVLRKAGVEPKEIGYVEMHGTGTQAGDTIEMEAVSRVFGNNRTKENPLYVGSVKPSVGHGEAASGVTSLIKAIEMLRNNTIPPQPGFPGPRNKKFDYIDELNIFIPETSLPFQSGPSSRDGKRRILISNFDATGGNNAMLLEDAPVRPQKTGMDPRSHQIIAISAKTRHSLKKNTERLLEYLERHQGIRLSDLAYTTTARRIHENLRRSYAVESVDQLRQLLQTDLRKDGGDRDISPVKRSSIVFTFTGQGSQYGGMGKQLFATSPRFRRTVESLHEICKWHEFPSFINLIASGEVSIERYSSVQTQLAIIVLEIALADLWKSWDIEPDLVVGYSLGEYAALHVAGVFSVHDVLYLVGRRAMLIQEKCSPATHAMLAIQASEQYVEEKIFSYPSCEISCKGAPKSTVVSGSVDDIVNLQSQLKAEGYSCTLLDVPYGFHSSQVDPILDDFRNVAEKVNFGKPRIPVASTLTGAMVRDEGVFSPSYLVNQARKPVDFMRALEACRNENLVDDDSVWIKIGPNPVLGSLVGNALNVSRRKLLHTINNKEEDWKAIAKSMASAYLEALPINWTNFHRNYAQFLNMLELPSYAFDLKNYWITTKKTSQVEVQLAGTQYTPYVPGFPTTTLQRVQEESFDELKAVVTFESIMCEPMFLSVAQGHIINGVPLFPGSTFVDMAFSAAKYIYQRTESGSPVPAMSLTKLIMMHPLIPDPEKKLDQVVVTRAERKSGSAVVIINFGSRKGRTTEDCASCEVYFGDETEWKNDWALNEYFVNAAKDNIVRSAKAGSGHYLHQKVVYKLFANLARYDASFKAMEEVFVEEDFTSNAVARVKLPPMNTHNFTFSPYWADSLIHVSGFLLNGKPDDDGDDVWIITKLGTFRMLSTLQPGTQYQSYAHIQKATDDGAAHCDVYVFEGDTIVGSSTGMIFQRVARRLLDVVLGKSSAPIGITTTDKPIHTAARASRPGFEDSHASNMSSFLSEIGKSGSETSATLIDGDDVEDVIAVILASTGVDPSDVEPSTQIADLGLDSILSIEVISDIKKKLGKNLPVSFFIHHPTVADVRKALGNNDASIMKLKTHEVPAIATDMKPTPILAQKLSDPSNGDVVMKVILDMTGVDPDDVEPFTLISDMGLDSILTVEVIGELRNKTGIELPTSFFNQHLTVADVKMALGHAGERKANAPAENNPLVSYYGGIEGDPKTPTRNRSSISNYCSNVVLVQGSATSDKIPLFLIADGGGSATSYMSLSPLFPGDNPVYGCESPFLDNPEDYVYTIEEVSDLYAAAIRKIQPHGPYLLGGWSLGALFAFEVSKRFLSDGEVVQGLFVLDFKFPVLDESRIMPTMETVETIGMSNGVNVPGKGIWAPATYKAKLHSLQSLRAAAKYKMQPMNPGRSPLNTYVVWAGLGLETLLGEIPAGIQEMLKAHSNPNANFRADAMLLWLFGNRQKREGPDGWDKATRGSVHCSSLPCDHFTMVNKPFAEHTGKHLRQLLTRCLAG